ncbi:hypothetical protein AGABI1DRAFT_124043 [Agaricus bisporus var. burnettii JB137-S8]|uniref:Uncharacterized protein n=1 Tax=Agaricus bisporus var. burnettii (strain JB137-S8 / ATCC MYA-4627 / FGSC 10392) TaxID=597362 RepID=K5X759_AGABU|nr:uncharacterized protein AGABI1DRAFT_124043 [Agaricus bisporus var. burnettii JB137-S8]EKM83716.1 hypothetical protein AGABI1DRAFT_124043 [Agaricus bisporus var. burnettii JB137-S8]
MASSTVPTIHISPAPPQEHLPEPYSPFRNLSFLEPQIDAFRPTHLSPPPIHASFRKHLSPLCPPDTPLSNKGLERQRFEALLRASKERNALVGAKKAVDLRKEIVHKAHQSKLVERRALFLSKVHAPPSPAATITPKTPPDSPAIFHYSLPSPGLVSPLALFDSLHNNNDSTEIGCDMWVEQVDFRLPKDNKKQVVSRSLPRESKVTQVLPSLDQISARLKTLASARSTTIVDGLRPSRTVKQVYPASSNRHSTIEVGRLRMPIRSSKSPSTIVPESTQNHSNRVSTPSETAASSVPSALQDTSTVASSPAQLTESNLKILDARERKAHNMLSTLRRRTLSTPQQAPQSARVTNKAMPGSLTRNAAKRTTPLPLPEDVMQMDSESRKSQWKRHSAPADLIPRERTGFERPVFAYPGAF